MLLENLSYSIQPTSNRYANTCNIYYAHAMQYIHIILNREFDESLQKTQPQILRLYRQLLGRSQVFCYGDCPTGSTTLITSAAAIACLSNQCKRPESYLK